MQLIGRLSVVESPGRNVHTLSVSCALPGCIAMEDAALIYDDLASVRPALLHLRSQSRKAPILAVFFFAVVSTVYVRILVYTAMGRREQRLCKWPSFE